jgi:hypothetical protein
VVLRLTTLAVLLIALATPTAIVGSRITVRNGSGSSIGRIDTDGTIRNGSGSSRGRFEGYSSSDRHIAAAWLFFMVPLHEE